MSQETTFYVTNSAVVCCLLVSLMVFNATLINISVISWPVGFIGGGNWRTWRKPPTCRKSLNALFEIQTRRRL
jgi:hypothetical protein